MKTSELISILTYMPKDTEIDDVVVYNMLGTLDGTAKLVAFAMAPRSYIDNPYIDEPNTDTHVNMDELEW